METPPALHHGAHWLFSLALWSQACAPGPAAGAPGPLAGAPAGFDFGRVHEGSVLTHDWEFEVQSPLVLASVRTDCGCTLARLERAAAGAREVYEFGTPLAAGERLFVSARYDTRGKRGAARRSLVLTTDAGVPIPLFLAANVQPWLVIEPPEFDNVRLPEGTGAERSFRVRAVDGARFSLRSTGEGLPPSVTVAIAPEDADASGRATSWSGTVRVGAGTPRGTHSYPIELASDVPAPRSDAEGEERTFRIAPAWTLQILGPVALSQPSLEFGLVRANETVAQTVRLECFDPKFTLTMPVARLEPLRPTDPFPLGETAGVVARAVPGQPAFDIEVTLGGLSPQVSGTFLARLVVETGHPALARLEATVHGVRAPGDGASAEVR